MSRKIKRIRKVFVRGKWYGVILHPDRADSSGYWLQCPELKGCASQGDTVKEALISIKDAIKGHLEVINKKEGGQI